MAAQDEMMMDDDASSLSSSISTECSSSSSSSSSSLIEYSSSLSTDLLKPTVNKTVSNKRRLMLDIEGYNFQLKNVSKDQTVKFWRCANRTCRVLVHTTLENEFIRYGGKSSIYSHLPNPSATEVRNLREAMRKRAENEITSLQKIAEQEVRQALLTGEALAVLPRINNLGHNLVHQRRKATLPVPQSSSFFLPESFTKDFCDKDRLLLYDSDDLKFQLKESGHMRCVPVLYALLPDRKAPTCVHLFNVLFNEAERLHKKFDPKTIMTDFEPGLTKAISLEFTENTTQKGCYFHFTKAIYRNVQSCGLASVYMDNMVIRNVIRRIMALALVPAQFVSTLFNDLQNDLNEYESDELAPLF
ncbi:unnamed protein product, partial [Rotaria sp. Silwood1]